MTALSTYLLRWRSVYVYTFLNISKSDEDSFQHSVRDEVLQNEDVQTLLSQDIYDPDNSLALLTDIG
jgi:hypothetical protein